MHQQLTALHYWAVGCHVRGGAGEPAAEGNRRLPAGLAARTAGTWHTGTLTLPPVTVAEHRASSSALWMQVAAFTVSLCR